MKSTEVGNGHADMKKETLKSGIELRKRICPMCLKFTTTPHGPVSDKVGCCLKVCSDEWDTLPFDEKQERLDTAHVIYAREQENGKLKLVPQAA